MRLRGGIDRRLYAYGGDGVADPASEPEDEEVEDYGAGITLDKYCMIVQSRKRELMKQPSKVKNINLYLKRNLVGIIGPCQKKLMDHRILSTR